MGNDFMVPIVPTIEHDGPTAIGQPHLASLTYLKMLRTNCTSVDCRKNKTIDHDSSQFLHQIQCQGPAARAQYMHNADIGVESGSAKSTCAIRREHSVEQRQQGIDGIQWRPSIPTISSECSIVIEDQILKDPEIIRSTIALYSPELGNG